MKKETLERLIKELNEVANSILCITDTLSDAAKEEVEVKVEKPKVTIDVVRTVLSGKSLDGFTSNIRDLLKKYGAEKLSEIDPKNYEALLKDAKEIGND